MASTAGTQHRCVFVGNIPYDATEEQLVQICEEVGPVVNFRLVVDRETGKPKGYGFCEYKDEETALSARRNLQGYEINGRQLRVDFAENDKGTDRNREQGRGGPGLTSNLEFQKPLPAPPILGDSNLHQQIGLPAAATAASIMARVLSGAQSTSMPAFQNGLPSTSGLGNDPLTHYLSKMTRYQLTEVMSAVKTLTTQNMPMAQQLLQGSPHLPKALFQAEILLGMVSPQMLQMASNQQSSSVLQPSLQDWVQDQKPVLSSHLGQMPSHKEVPGSTFSRSPDDQVPSALPNSLVRQQSPLPFQNVPVQPPLQHPLPPQAQVHTHTQTMTPGTSGVLMIQTYQPQSLGGFSIQPHIPSLPTSKGLISQIQPPLLQHPRSTGVANTAHPHLVHPSANLQTSVVRHPPMAQAGLSNHLELDTFQNKAGISASAIHNLSWSSKTQMQSSLREQTGMTGDMSELTVHRSKRPRLEDVSEAPQLLTSGSAISKSFPVQSIPTGLSGSHTNYMQNSEKQISQLPPEVESALLQQVISLTPEQLSSLPLEQQQQVLQLQQMLR